MAGFWQRIARIKKTPRDIVGLEYGPTVIRGVRVRRLNDSLSVVAAEILPGLPSEHPPASLRSHLPDSLAARYISICVPSDRAVVKLLSLPGALADDAQAQIKERMGIEEGNYRIGYRILSAGHGRTETRLLTAAIPDDEALAVSAAFAIGWPVPVAVELAGLAALTAFEQGPGQAYREQNIGVIVMEERATFAAFFSKGELVLIRKFDFGHGYLSDAIQTSLNVDHATAIKIIADGSFDISQIVKAVAEPFIKQLVISKLFIERRENCQLAKFFVPSGKTVARAWLDEVQAAVGMEVDAWNPLANISLAPAALASSLEGEEVSLAAALGAALGSLEALAES